MSREWEQQDRRMLRARAAMDRDVAEPLERPGPPSMDEETAAQVRELVSKGVVGGIRDPFGNKPRFVQRSG